MTRSGSADRSQTLRASASEVAAMVEGAIRHGTTMSVKGNYVDSHGQSEIGFGITRLLNINLPARTKRINKVRLYRPAAGAHVWSPAPVSVGGAHRAGRAVVYSVIPA